MCHLQGSGSGAPQVVTAGQDGGVRVWDTRQPDAPALAFLPAQQACGGGGGGSSSSSSSSTGMGSGSRPAAPECWCVAIGNAYNADERCVLAGYANGDLKMFDLRTASVRWETNVGKGVCGVQVGAAARLACRRLACPAPCCRCWVVCSSASKS